MIFPVKEANFLAETTNSFLIISSMNCSIFVILISDMLIQPSREFQTIPNHSIIWQGTQTDLSTLQIRPELTKLHRIVLASAKKFS